jgi:hypothetical protein
MAFGGHTIGEQRDTAQLLQRLSDIAHVGHELERAVTRLAVAVEEQNALTEARMSATPDPK